jgi:CheY-like chemotaxis protein
MGIPIVLAEPHLPVAEAIFTALNARGFDLTLPASLEEAADALARSRGAAMLVLSMDWPPRPGGMPPAPDFLQWVASGQHVPIPRVILCYSCTPASDTALRALAFRTGADDFLTITQVVPDQLVLRLFSLYQLSAAPDWRKPLPANPFDGSDAGIIPD